MNMNDKMLCALWSFVLFSSISLLAICIIIGNIYDYQRIVLGCLIAGCIGVVISCILCRYNPMKSIFFATDPPLIPSSDEESEPKSICSDLYIKCLS